MQSLTIRATIVGLLILFLTACGSSSDDGGGTPVVAPVSVNISAVTPAAPLVGQAVSFTAMGTGDGISYAWTFGDGQTASGANPSHTFTTAGGFDVAVTVTDQRGVSAKASAHVVVSNAAISASIASIAPLSPSTGQVVNLQGAGTGQGSLSYAWTFGDGQKATGAKVTHSYSTAGNYTITLVVTDSAGQTATASNGIKVVSTPPVNPPVVLSNISATPESAAVGQQVTVAATGSGGTGTLSYDWDFGDGKFSEGVVAGSRVTATHVYATAGSYTIKLVATDEAQQTASTTKTVTVGGVPGDPPVTVQIDSITPTSPSVGQSVSFIGSGSGKGGISYTWSYGDGSGGAGVPTTTPAGKPGTAGQHAYTQAGTYTVTLTAVDSTGRRASTTQTVATVNAPVLPTANIYSVKVANAPIHSIPPLSAQTLLEFKAEGTGSGALTYNWDFGDGSTGTGDTANHTYTNVGSYTVALTVTDSTGLTSTKATKSIDVVNPSAPSALTLIPQVKGFVADSSIYLATTVTGSGPLTYTWNFGDGSPVVTTQDRTSPLHSYAIAGVYTVSMTVSDSFNQHATATAVVVSPNVIGILTYYAQQIQLRGIAFDHSKGDLYFIKDETIQKMSATGVITTLAGGNDYGFVDGQGSSARFSNPYGLAVDSATGTVYVADTLNQAIRKISPTGVVSTFASGFLYPQSVLFDSTNQMLYVTDTNNHTIDQVTPEGVVTTIAGLLGQSGAVDGTGSAARFNQPRGLALDPATGTLYVSDETNATIRKITTGGVVTTIAGSAGQKGFVDGVGAAARFSYPAHIEFDAGSGLLYLADNGAIRVINPATGAVITKVGNPAGGVFSLTTTGITSGNPGATSLVVTAPGTIVFNGAYRTSISSDTFPALYRVHGL